VYKQTKTETMSENNKKIKWHNVIFAMICLILITGLVIACYIKPILVLFVLAIVWWIIDARNSKPNF
jgi:uncharacterized membrane protein